MTTPIPTHETALEKERRLYRELSARLLDTILNGLFDLRPEKAARRSSYLAIFFVFCGFLISIVHYPLALWTAYISNLLVSTLSTSSSPEQFNAAITGFGTFLQAVITDPRILQYLPIFLAPFFIALQSAAMYLADVFELEDVGVARQFVRAVALSGSNETIRIKQGNISSNHLDSPTYLIGGPGKVVVELDSIALFERADGTPHVIGPTGNKPGSKESLEGFERFRQAINIRDHHITLGVESRSRDGIPIEAADVRLMFSIYRGKKPEPSPAIPYPFDEEAIKNIVYKSASRVTPELPNPSTYDFSWINNMTGLIRARLGRFMSEHNLTEYLASIGSPEVEKVKEREKKIALQMQQLTQSDDEPAEKKETNPLPEFQARYKIKNMFAQFTDDFSNQARNNGVELQWIGVGTWESPIESVLQDHLDAWILSQENLQNESPGKMGGIEKAEVTEKTKELIQKVPLGAFEELFVPVKSPKKQGKQSSDKKRGKVDEAGKEEEDKEIPQDELDGQFAEVLNILQTMRGEADEYEEQETDHDNNMKYLLIEYRKQLIETADLIREKNEQVPQNIQDAIRYIGNQIGHWAGQPNA